MRIAKHFRELIEDIGPKFWSHEEKEALLKIIHEIYNCDYAFGPEEVEDFNKKLKALGCNIDEIQEFTIERAIEILQRDKLKHELIYLIIAEAIFKDEDYDSLEKEYIQKFTQKYGLLEDTLKEKIEKISNEKFANVLSEWLKKTERDENHLIEFIFEEILSHAQRERANKEVLKVKVRLGVGAQTDLKEDSLKAYFSMLARGTLLEKTDLELSFFPGSGFEVISFDFA